MTAERALAETLLGCSVDHVRAVSGGGNNRLYRVDAARSHFAMKLYASGDAGGMQRFRRETAALTMLGETGLADRVPRLVNTSERHSAVLFDWIDGTVPNCRGPGDLAEMLAFVADLQTTATLPGAKALGEAAEACFSGAELARQIDGRRERLGSVGNEPALTEYLGRFDRLWSRWRPTISGFAEIPPCLRILSPSDFGFHNTLRRPDGRLVFLDFEYFGWDDPVKLAADIAWHPGMMLDETAVGIVMSTMTRLYGGEDPAYGHRLSVMLPAYGLRWCLILLNEFLPERWGRRRRAQDIASSDWPLAKRRQLEKAERMIVRVETCCEEIAG